MSIPYTRHDLVYLHKIYRHEIGYRGEVIGAGAFWYISKEATKQFFPTLSNNILNDRLNLKILLPDGRLIYLRYVYHNDKLLGMGTRDEYRIYIGGLSDVSSDFFEEDNILLFSKLAIKGPSGNEYVYQLKVIREKDDSKVYSYFYGIMSGSNHRLIRTEEAGETDIRVPAQYEGIMVPDDIIEESAAEPVEEEVIEEEVEYETRETKKIIRSTSFRDLVLFFYNFKCAITGESIRYNELNNVQACHIIPKHRGGSDSVRNGLSLGRDLHWAFDRGFLTINSDYIINVHNDSPKSKLLTDINHSGLKLPEDSRAQASREALRWHNEQVYGNFLKY